VSWECHCLVKLSPPAEGFIRARAGRHPCAITSPRKNNTALFLLKPHLSYMDHADPVHKRAFYLLSRIAGEFKKIVEDSTDELTFVA
jgi:hypothetical protein